MVLAETLVEFVVQNTIEKGLIFYFFVKTQNKDKIHCSVLSHLLFIF